MKANELWQQAEGLVAAEPKILQRVKLSRMSIDYAIVERARFQAQKKLPTNDSFMSYPIVERIRLRAQGKLPANDSFMSLAVARFKPFIKVLRSSSLTRLGEQTPLDKDVYSRDLARDLKIQP